LDNINAESPSGREFRGGVYLFEQERQFGDDAVIQTPENKGGNHANDYTERPFELRTELIRLGLRAEKGDDPRYTQIRDGYNYVCAPNTMRDVIVDGEEWNIEFRTRSGDSYTFDGLSSGERSVIYFLTRYATMQIRNAIVLIDELEMHLHPTWQRRLYESLKRFNDNNQFIVTTHSPTVEQIAPDEAIISLGDLDIPDWQLEMSYSDE